MEAWLHSLLAALALPRFGLSTVFVVSLVSATLLPLGSEPAVFGLVKLNPELFWPAVLVATAGNTIGGAISWWMGFGAEKLYERVRHRKLEARALQELDIRRSDRVLEIGTGSGYLTALLAAEAAEVVSVDIVPEFTASAGQKLRAHGIGNVELHSGDAARDWNDAAGFDVIVLTGSTPLLSDALVRRLRPGGRLFAVVGEAPVMQAQLVTCTAPGAYRSVTLFETCIKALANAPHPAAFVF
jgi:protein-L-isoaspartate(D-aspartate) O-methyltransferase